MTLRRYQDRAPTVAAGAYVDASAVVIGDVAIGADSSVWPLCVLRGDINLIRVGARSNIQDGSIVHVTHRSHYNPDGYATLIGDDVTIGHRVILHGCTVESRCLIGMGCVIMDGALLRSEVLLGAGSLVTEGKELDGGYLWLGRPARRVRALTPEERALFDYSARHYVEVKDCYLGQT